MERTQKIVIELLLRGIYSLVRGVHFILNCIQGYVNVCRRIDITGTSIWGLGMSGILSDFLDFLNDLVGVLDLNGFLPS